MFDKFSERHIGVSNEKDLKAMLDVIGVKSVDELISQVIPQSIRLRKPLALPAEGMSEYEFAAHIRELADRNQPYRSFIGMGYYPSAVPAVVTRNVFENPAWYTSYTPYQAEISQGRLEALLNFQTAVISLTGMEIGNCSLLDEGTAAAEAMAMMFSLRSRDAVREGRNQLFVDRNIFPQTLDVLLTRSEPFGIELIVDDYDEYEFTGREFGAIVQYPAADGRVRDYSDFTAAAHAKGALVTVAADLLSLALEQGINFYYPSEGRVRMSFDEVTTAAEIETVVSIFAAAKGKKAKAVKAVTESCVPTALRRQSPYLQEPVFNAYRSESALMRYIKKLELRDISLANSMISLGSCTMKLNAAALMQPLSLAGFQNMHPFAPADQAKGYMDLIAGLEQDLATITGFAACSLQPNSGAAGEYTGLMVIRAYHQSRGQGYRNVVLIPASAHGTNPASAAMAGMKIVTVACDERGNIDVADLEAKAKEHSSELCGLMVTYPSTHGVFESRIREIVDAVHDAGGQVYMDGANMNAQVGLTNPGYIGADVCHLNLHKTFAMPHGGGGPGVGPICVAEHLRAFLPSHPVVATGGDEGITAVASAPWGSALLFPITYGYIKMLGAEGLRRATEMAIVNANYMSAALAAEYRTYYSGETGRVGHEMILDLTSFKKDYNIDCGDIAHRLMDYGFHAPTLSFPVHETLMVEPTESEPKEEMDRFIEALISIKRECEAAAGQADNVVANAPHTARELAGAWEHPYSRDEAAFPLAWIGEAKFFPYVSKIDNGYGDRNLCCRNCE